MRVSNVWQSLMLPPWRFLSSRWPWLGLVYSVTSALLALVLVPLVIVTFLLLPLWGMLVAAVDRRRLPLLGVPSPASGHVHVPSGERHNWLNVRLTEPATWRETLSMLAGLVLGVLALVVLCAEALVFAALVGIPVLARQRDAEINLFGDVHLVIGAETWWQPLMLIPVALVVFAYVNALLAALHGGCVRWLIAPRVAEIDQRVEQLTRSRAAIVTAHEQERRRLERDLHDGVQQDLVAIAVRLGMLELELAGGDDRSRKAALEEAQLQTERALTTLRNTVQGIHPAVLSDHGLAAALDDLAGRSAIPLRVEHHEFPRLAPESEAAAYFFAAEALTNAAKHTTAASVTVRLFAGPSGIRVEAEDHGHGGADAARGSGLRGLAERADALGGSLLISSPLGGPTRLTLTLPVGARSEACSPPTHRQAEEVPGAHPAR